MDRDDRTHEGKEREGKLGDGMILIASALIGRDEYDELILRSSSSLLLSPASWGSSTRVVTPICCFFVTPADRNNLHKSRLQYGYPS